MTLDTILDEVNFPKLLFLLFRNFVVVLVIVTTCFELDGTRCTDRDKMFFHNFLIQGELMNLKLIHVVLTKSDQRTQPKMF